VSRCVLFGISSFEDSLGFGAWDLGFPHARV
jgi:hypothetical protein